jgi:uncharacterized protein (TIGR00290 family)
MGMPRVLVSWSSGKDAAWMLHVLRESQKCEVVGLITTLNAETGRVAMHDTQRSLLDLQAVAAGLPLLTVALPWPCSNAIYESSLLTAISQARDRWQIDSVAFADLFLEDVRRYRELQLASAGLQLLFPLWGIPTDRLAREMTSSGLRAVLACIDPNRLDRRFAGRVFDDALLDELPKDVDPCGERGEFHTFAFDGPMFSNPIHVASGESSLRDGFVFTDVLPL